MAYMKNWLIPDILDTNSIACLPSGEPASAGLHSTDPALIP